MNREDWQAETQARVMRWCKRHPCKVGTIEQLRGQIKGLPEPADLRWWGSIATALGRSGHLIRLDQTRPARSSNHSPKPVWFVRRWV